VVKLKAIISQKRAEEMMWWHAESPLIECHKRHHVSSHRQGERRVLCHPTSLKLRHHHKPMLHEFLLVAWHNGGRGPIPLRHVSRRKEGQYLRDPGIFFLFLFCLLSSFSAPLSFFSHGEGGKERMMDGAQGYRGAQGLLCHTQF
jgi:hypothetical protein